MSRPFESSAMRYVERGWPVFPLSARKKTPATSNGFKDATRDPVSVKSWAERLPSANIGIPTGAETFDVLDVDGPEGEATLARILERYGPLPDTTETRTGRGRQFWFAPSGLTCTASRIGKGLDTRGAGGYVVAPPSVHPNGAVYTFTREGVFAPAPTWLLEAIGKANESTPATASRDSHGSSTPYGRAALGGLFRDVAGAPEGTRNDALNRAAHRAGRLVGGGQIAEGDALEVLTEGARRAGLVESEARKTLASGLGAGLAEPAAVPRTFGSLALAPEPLPEGEPWPARRQLPALSEPVPSLPLDLLPPVLRGWLGDISDRIAVPPEFVAVPALVGLGSVVGRSIALRPMERDDWTVPANLWGGIVGPPGVMKSAAVEQGLKPVRRLAAAARKVFEDAKAGQEADAEVLGAKRKALLFDLDKAAKKRDAADLANRRDELKALGREEEDAAPTERRFLTSDATIEKLGSLLNENPRGLLVVRDELTGWLRGLDRDDRAQDRSFYLEAWNGTGAFTVDRIGRGTLNVEALCLSVVGGIQPGPFGAYVRGAVAGESNADGLMQRFQLLAWPDDFGEWRGVDRWPDRQAADRAFSVFEHLANAEAADLGAETPEEGLPFLRFAPDAQALFLEWRRELEARLRQNDLRETPAFEAHVAKFRSLLPKLALLFHLVDVADGGPRGPVPLKCTTLAAAWVDFLEAHARKVYAAEIARDVHAARALADKIRAGHVTDGMSVRDVWRHEWAGLTTSGAVVSAGEVLEGLGWVRLLTRDSGGRPSELIRLHPELRGRG